MALGDSLAASWRAARERWPEVELPYDTYVRHVETVVPEGAVVEQLHTVDLFLAAAVTAGDRAALAAFDAEHIATIGRHVARVDPSAQFVDEVKQALRERLLVGEVGAPPRIGGYTGQGPLGGWVRVAALRVALNLRRGRGVVQPLEDVLELAANAPTPELALILERSRAAVEAAVRAAFAALTREDRALLRLHLLEDLSIDALARVHQIHRSTVARRLQAARRSIVDHTLAELTRELGLAPPQLESLIGLVRSRLELSMHELLATLG